MLQHCFIAILLCSQLAAPAMSGKFVCLAKNGCICVDAGPETCKCHNSHQKSKTTCSCGCHKKPLQQGFESSHQDCTHIAVSKYEAISNISISIDILLAIAPVSFEAYTVPLVVNSLVHHPLLSDDSATLTVLSTVVLRI